MVGGAVMDYTGDELPDLFMVVRVKSVAAAAILTTDSGGDYTLLVRVLDRRELASPEAALISRLEGLRKVVAGLPKTPTRSNGVGAGVSGEARGWWQCGVPDFCGWWDVYAGGDCWWAPQGTGVANLGNWTPAHHEGTWNDQTSIVANTTSDEHRISDNCAGCPAGEWVAMPGNSVWPNMHVSGWGDRMTALYTQGGSKCW